MKKVDRALVWFFCESRVGRWLLFLIAIICFFVTIMIVMIVIPVIIFMIYPKAIFPRKNEFRKLGRIML